MIQIKVYLLCLFIGFLITIAFVTFIDKNENENEND